ncbi:MAG: anti-sigma factor family protein, partial [Candidatus Sericytochromatia bacterium]
MTCAATEERLSDYLDGALAPEERAQVDAHLEGCEHCRQDLEELRFVVEMLHKVPQEDVPEGLSARIHEALAALPEEEAPAPTVVSIDEARAKKGGSAPWWQRFSVTSAAAGAAVAVF